MPAFRIIPRLDLKDDQLTKGIQMEGLRVVGPACTFIEKYYADGADELFISDAVATLHRRQTFMSAIQPALKNVFIPITYAGGISSIEAARDILRSGADKIAINTAALKNPSLLPELAEEFGEQAVILSIEALYDGGEHWEAMSDRGRERSGVSVLSWVEKAHSMGVGEVVITSVDRDGTGKGLDLNLIRALKDRTDRPLVIGGGIASTAHIEALAPFPYISGVAIASALHYGKIQISDIRIHLAGAFKLREVVA